MKEVNEATLSAEKKYELTWETVEAVNGTILYRIRALRDIPGMGVKVGDFGGYIEHEGNLSHNNDAWVSESANVSGGARVCDNALVSGFAWIFGNARVSDEARVYDTARIFGDAHIFNEARVYASAWVFGNAQIFGGASVLSNAWVLGDARVCESDFITGDTYVAAE